jgi:NAD(P)-dependent dehydrogenase (short-subunit alcohol dehydrogenase family)
MQFSGVIVLVTGASQGIGKEIALQFAREGAHVCALARNKIDLDALVEKIRATGGHASAHAVDVTQAVSIRATINEIGQRYAHIDILVHAVGGFKRLLQIGFFMYPSGNSLDENPAIRANHFARINCWRIT